MAGDGEEGHRDGAAAQARFDMPRGLAVLPDDRVLVGDVLNHRIRVLSADLQQVSTVAGDGEEEHRDGAAAQARFNGPTGLAVLPDGRVLVADSNCIRVLSADLQDVSTLVIRGVHSPSALAVRPSGSVLVADGHRIHIVVTMGPKPAAKPPKQNKRALADSSSGSSGPLGPSGPALKRGRSEATMPSSSSSSDDSEEEGGSTAAAAAEATFAVEEEGGSTAAKPLLLYPFRRLRF